MHNRRTLIFYFLFAMLLTSCGTTPISPTITPTKDICPQRALELWAASVQNILDDSEYLYVVADTCSDSECLTSVAYDFMDFAEFLDRGPSPPICAQVIHGMVRQNLFDEGQAFLFSALGDYDSSIYLRQRALNRMDTVDHFFSTLLQGVYDVNLAYELDQLSATETALPEISTPSPQEYCLVAGDAMDRFVLYGFEDFEETEMEDGETVLLLEELDKDAHGRVIMVSFDGNCVDQIIAMISNGPGMSHTDVNKNKDLMPLVSSMGAEEYHFAEILPDLLSSALSSLRITAEKEGVAEGFIDLGGERGYPQAHLELRIYASNEEALMYSIEFGR